MKTLIQAAEVWVPDAEGHLLVLSAGLYGSAAEFGAVSRSMCFGRGEGLPGRVWEEGRPLLLKDLQGGYFLRAAAARRAGLACAAAMPVYLGDQFKAVVVFFCGGEPAEAGAIELWRNNPRVTGDMTLVDGHYGAAAGAFAEASRDTYLPRGAGLPGLAWQREGSVFLDGLPGSSKFLRAEAAGAAGIQRGLGLPCAAAGHEHFVLVLLGTAAMPVARRVESWVVTAPRPMGTSIDPPGGSGPAWERPGARPGAGAAGQGPQRAYGHCEIAGALPVGERAGTAGCLAKAFVSAVPQLSPNAAGEPEALGASAAAAGLDGMIVLPIARDGVVAEAVALYF